MSRITSVGIDLGTTNCALTVYANGKLSEKTFPGTGPQLPSVVCWPDGEEPIVGAKGLRAGYKTPDRVFTHFKRGMYDAAQEPWHGGQHTPIQLTAPLIKEIITTLLKAQPDIKAHLEGRKPREHVSIFMSHPANWGIQQQDALREAARLAGIEVDGLLEEPVAAAKRVLQEQGHHVRQNDLIAVIDFGGGTLDCTIHRYDQGVLHTEVGATGDPHLGGDNFTGVIFQAFCPKTRLKFQSCFDPVTGLNLRDRVLSNQTKRQQAISLWSKAAEAKEQLSTSETATVFFDTKGGPVELAISRSDLESISKELWDKFETAVAGMLKGSSLNWSDIPIVVVAGGSAMLHGATERVARVTERSIDDVLVSSDSAHVVSSGCAIAGYLPEEADRHIARGLGIRLLSGGNGKKTYRNKFFFGVNHIVPKGGEAIEDLGQELHSPGGRSTLSVQFVEAKPAVPVPDPHEGMPVILDDSEVVPLQTICADVDLPRGTHAVRTRFSVDPNGATSYHFNFPSLSQQEGIGGTLTAETQSGPTTASGQFDVALVFDASGSMYGKKLDRAKEAVRNLLDQVSDDNVRVCLIPFGKTVAVESPFGATSKEVHEAVDRLEADGGTPMTEALELAIKGLRRQPGAAQYMTIVITDGHPNCVSSAEQKATELKQHSELICFGIGQDVDQALLTRMATSTSHYFFAENPDAIPQVFQRIVELFLVEGTAHV